MSEKNNKTNELNTVTEWSNESCEDEYRRISIIGNLIPLKRKEHESSIEQLKRIACKNRESEEIFEDELEQAIDCYDGECCIDAYIDAFVMCDEHDEYVVIKDEIRNDIKLFVIKNDKTTYNENSVKINDNHDGTYSFELDYVPDEDNFCSRVIPLQLKMEELLNQD